MHALSGTCVLRNTSPGSPGHPRRHPCQGQPQPPQGASPQAPQLAHATPEWPEAWPGWWGAGLATHGSPRPSKSPR
eukprot:3837920-Lingulodinium_polyedra.AAC.1